MIPVAAVAGKGKQPVVVFIVADPIAAALGFGQVLGFAAQPAARFVAVCLPDDFGCLLFHLHPVDGQESLT